MSRYRLETTRVFNRQFRKFDERQRRVAYKFIEKIIANPEIGKPLR